MANVGTILALGLPPPPTGAVVDLAGNFAPSVALNGALNYTWALAGDLAPSVAFNGDVVLGAPIMLAGDLAPIVGVASSGLQEIISLQGNLVPNVQIQNLPALGNMTAQVVIGSAQLIAGPLWEPVEPCQPLQWRPSELCNG